MSGSKPLNKIISKNELFKKLHSLKNQPTAIPYVTSYYKKDWGFCISHKEKLKFNNQYKTNDKFRVVINSSLNKVESQIMESYSLKEKVMKKF